MPFFCITLAVTAVLARLPNLYTSTATLLVVQQQVPQRYVVPNSTTDVASALQAMKQEVLSRTQLLRMINDFGLYPKQRRRLAPEELVALMLSNIDIVPTVEAPQAQQQNKDFDAFHISFTAENAALAQQVTNNLTSLFTNEYLRTQAEQATNTTDFLKRRVDEKGKELEAQEARLRDFKLSHVGELPEEQQGNLAILTGLQTRLSNAESNLNRAQQQRALWQAQLEATMKRRSASETAAPIFTPGAPITNQILTPLQAAQNNLALLEAEKSKMLLQGRTVVHPDVISKQREIEHAEAVVNRLKAAPPTPEKNQPSTTAPASTSRAIEATDDPAVDQFKTNLEANRLEIDNLAKEEAKLKAQISQYENRINQTPVREQQQAGIQRDTEVLRQQYAELEKKEQDSQLSTNLEKEQGGQQFRLIDPASLPGVPSKPKRVKMSMGGAAGGLLLGLVLAVLMEMRDTSFHTEKELTEQLAPPFVLGIPVLPTPVEKRRRKWRNLFQWATASAMILVVLAAEFYVYKRG